VTVNLPISNATILRLTDYLVASHNLLPSVRKMRVEYSEDEDTRNQKNPRGFCHVTEGEWIIYCSQVLEEVAPSVRVGLLLHEIGHLYIPAMSSEKSEVDVDAWILETIPEAGYGYLPTYRYYNTLYGRTVTAKNVQHVSNEFVYGRLAGVTPELK
jgi:hypothetical protein